MSLLNSVLQPLENRGVWNFNFQSAGGRQFREQVRVQFLRARKEIYVTRITNSLSEATYAA